MIPQTAMLFLRNETFGSAVRLADALLPNILSQLASMVQQKWAKVAPVHVTPILPRLSYR